MNRPPKLIPWTDECESCHGTGRHTAPDYRAPLEFLPAGAMRNQPLPTKQIRCPDCMPRPRPTSDPNAEKT